VSFFESQDWADDSRRQSKPRRFFGFGFLLVFTAGLLAAVFLPTPYVIESPGPTFNVLGETQGKPVIAVSGAKTFDTEGNLDVLTVSLLGSRNQTPSWIEIALAWMDPAKIVLPLDQAFPTGQTVEEARAESTAMMEESQQDAIAAALVNLGYEVPSHVYVSEVSAGAAASGKIKAADFIIAVNKVEITTVEGLREQVAKFDGETPLVIEYTRNGVPGSAEISPVKDAQGKLRLGLMVGYKFDFPIKIDLQLGDVGGPSGGMMFALGILDKLTPGFLNGGEYVAGTGTITPAGDVGPIGGIRQKLYGASDKGAKFFLAPSQNCDEVAGHIPEGLQVFSIAKLSDAVTVLEQISMGANLASLPSCSIQ
jgi:PDZ domain-containing protein